MTELPTPSPGPSLGEPLGRAIDFADIVETRRGRPILPQPMGNWSLDGVLGWPSPVIGGGAPSIQGKLIAECRLGPPKD